MSFVPGMTGTLMGVLADVPAGPPPPPVVPKSIVFTYDEVLRRVLSTSGAHTTIFTYSLWMKVLEFHTVDVGGCDMFSITNMPSPTTFICSDIFPGPSATGITLFQNSPETARAEASGMSPATVINVWHHYVIQWNSPSAVTADRVMFWRNGVALAKSFPVAISQNETHRMFQNGLTHNIGSFVPTGTNAGNSGGRKKIAFIDVVEGQVKTPTDFAFNNAGTWTRKPYTGVRGTYGFMIDGTDGFNDVSGNSQNFTGINMDASNLDAADLPPNVMV